MPFGHFISQVHLKNFNFPALDGKLFACRKSDLKRFQPDVDFIDEEVDENPCCRLARRNDPKRVWETAPFLLRIASRQG
jgi:hypothetical protein